MGAERKRPRSTRLTMDDRFLRAFAAMAKGVSRSLPLETILNMALEATLQDPRVEAVEIYLVDEERGELTYACQRGLSDQCAREAQVTPIKLGEGIIGRVASLGEPAVVLDLPREPRFPRDILKKQGYYALYSIPIRSADRVCGVWNLFFRTKRLSPRYLNWLGTSTEMLGVAFEYAQVMAESNARLEALRDSEEKYRHLVEDINDGYLVVRGNKVLFANERVAEVLQRPLEEIIGGPFVQRLTPETLEKSREIYERTRRGEPPPEIEEFTIQREDGTSIPIEARFKQITYEGERAYSAVIRDISERKRAEEETKLAHAELDQIFDTAADGMRLIDKDFNVLRVNKTFLTLSGVSKDEALAKKCYEVFHGPACHTPNCPLTRILGGKERVEYESERERNDGTRMPCIVTATPFWRPDGELIGIVEGFRDISERKRAEEALRESGEKYRTLVRDMRDAYLVVRGSRVFFANDRVAEIFRMPMERIMARGIFDQMTPDSQEKSRQIYEMTKRGELPPEIEELTFQLEDGTTITVEAKFVEITYEGERAYAVLLSDISERKRAEEVLRESEERLRDFFDNANDLIQSVAPDGRFMYVNRAWRETLGYTEDEIAGLSLFDIIHPDSRAHCMEIFQRVMDGEKVDRIEAAFVTKDGRTILVEGSANCRFQDGKPVATRGIFRDISERKQAEEELIQAAAHWQDTFDAIEDLVIIIDKDFRVVQANQAMNRAFPGAKVLGAHCYELMHGTEGPIPNCPSCQTFSSGEATHSELCEQHLDGRWFDAYAYPIKGKDGTVQQLVHIFRDITERKRGEEALRASEEKYRELFETTLDGMAVIDAETMRIVLANQAAVKIYGFDSVEDIVGVNPLDFIHPEDRDRALKIMVEDMFEHDLRQINEFRTITKDGREIWLSTVAIRTEYQGKLAGLASFRDITERKRAEEALKTSEEKYRHLMGDMNDGYMVVWGNKVLFANERVAEFLGRPVAEIIGGPFVQHLTPESIEKSREIYERTRRGEPPPEIEEFALRREDGSSVPLEVRFKEITYGGERAYSMLLRDITERKRAEEEIQRHTKQLEALYGVASVASQTLDLQELLDIALAKVLEVMNADAGGIYLFDLEAGEFTLKAHRGVSEEFVGSLGRIRLEKEEIERGMEWREPVFEAEGVFAEAKAVGAAAAMEKEGLKAYLTVPFWYRELPRGAIVIASRGDHQFAAEDVGLLTAIGNQIAVAIENVSLYQDVKDKAERLEVTAELTRIITYSLNIEDVFEAFVARVKRLVDFDRISIALVEGDKLRLFAVSSAVETERKAGTTFPLKDSATAWVVQNRMTNIEADLAQERQFPLDETFLREGLRSAIRLPLFSRGEVIGTFNFFSRRPNAYGQREWEILEELAGQIAVAIANDRLYREVKERKEALETAYSELLTSTEALDQSKRQLEDAYLKMARTLVLTIEARDPYSRGHSERVAQLSRQLAFDMGLPLEQVRNLESAARLHDLGKIGTPDGILLKPDELTPSERAEIQLHPTRSVDMLRFLSFINGTLDVIEHHHERYNGGGYPGSLKGEEIPLGARIIAVSDAYDAMTSARPYRPAMTSEQAMEILKKGAGSQWDPGVVAAFLHAFGKKGGGKNAR